MAEQSPRFGDFAPLAFPKQLIGCNAINACHSGCHLRLIPTTAGQLIAPLDPLVGLFQNMQDKFRVSQNMVLREKAFFGQSLSQ